MLLRHKFLVNYVFAHIITLLNSYSLLDECCTTRNLSTAWKIVYITLCNQVHNSSYKKKLRHYSALAKDGWLWQWNSYSCHWNVSSCWLWSPITASGNHYENFTQCLTLSNGNINITSVLKPGATDSASNCI